MKIFLIVLVVIMLSIIVFSIYYGVFSKVVIEQKTLGGETLVYQEVKGEYKQSAAVSDNVYYTLLNDLKITTYKGFGIYYNIPGTVPVEEMRSDVGSILEDSDLDRVKDIEGKFLVKKYPRKEYIVTEFPIKGKLSFLIGVFKVYPVLNKYSSENNFNVNSPVMEIWDIPNKKIIYRKEK